MPKLLFPNRSSRERELDKARYDYEKVHMRDMAGQLRLLITYICEKTNSNII